MLDDVKNFWDAIAGRIKGLIHSETKNALRMERYEVTTDPNGSKMGVTKPFGSTELMLPYSQEVSTATVGSQVLVAWWGSMSNAKVYFFANGFRGSQRSTDYTIYDSVRDLGLTSGSATISGAYSAMAGDSVLLCDASQFAAAELPYEYGMVEIVKLYSSGTRGIINFYAKLRAGGDYRMYIISSTNEPTGEWLPTTQVTQTSGTANLNDFKTPGLYYFSTGVTLSNQPNSGTNGWLQVLSDTASSVKQIWYRLGSNPTTFQDFYHRLYTSSAWGSWQPISDYAEPSVTMNTVSGWTFSNAALRKRNGIVSFQFTAETTTAPTTTAVTAYTLPAAYRPDYTVRARFVGASSGHYFNFSITSAGVVNVARYPSGVSAGTRLNVTFPVGN